MRAGLAFLVAALLTAVVSYGGTSKTPGGVEFTYNDPSAFSVSLAGSFNNWDTNANPMTKDDEGTWRVVVPLAQGKYEYKFVVNGSTWMADPENPKVVGDYGNSEIEINKDGEPVVSGVAKAISNTAANSRVMINGWFRGTYATRKDARAVYATGTPAVGDARWRLSRPAHEMYVSVNPTVGSEVKGSLTMHIDSGTGDIREIRTDLYSGRLTFEKTAFGVMAYYNEETLSFDEPLGAFGHQDLAGTAGEDEIAFGRGAQGVVGNLQLAGAHFQGSYSNVYDYDIYDSPLRWAYNFETEVYDSMPRYDNVGTDVIALRGERAFHGVNAGLTYLSKSNGWWVPFEGQNTSTVIDHYREVTGDSASYWFELGTNQWLLAGDVAVKVNDLVSLDGAYGKTSYQAKWDAGNRVRKQGTQFVDGKIDVPIGGVDGTRAKGGLGIEKGEHSAAISYERVHWDGMAEDEAYITKDALPFDDPDNLLVLDYGPALLTETEYRNTYAGVQNLDRFVVYEQQPLPERTVGTTRVSLKTRFHSFDIALDLCQAKRQWQYDYGDSAEYDLTWTRLLPSVGGSLGGDRLAWGVAYDMTSDNLSGRMPGPFDRDELLIDLNLKLRANWSLYCNLRRVAYDGGEPMAHPTDLWADLAQGDTDQSFFNPHLALVWTPVPRVEVRLGYGLSPLYYRDTPVEGRQIGRERYLSSFLWLNPTASLIEAEQALEDLKVISLMGVIAF